MGAVYSALLAALGFGQPPMVTDFMFVGDSLTFCNGGVWEEVARLAPEGALGHIETVVQGYAPLAKLLPMARATLQQLGPKEEGRRRVCVLQEDLPETTVASFESAARDLAALCEQYGWEVVLLSCWGYGAEGKPRPGLTPMSDGQVMKAHRRMATLLQREGHTCKIAPAGAAKARCELLLRNASLPAVPLLAKDNEHPSIALTHMMARCVVGAVYGRTAAAGAPLAETEVKLNVMQRQMLNIAVDEALAAEEKEAVKQERH